MKPYYVLYVEYPGELYPKKDESIRVLGKKFKGKETGSGMGFGTRDIGFKFKTIEEAKNFYKEARKKKFINKYYELYRWQMEEVDYSVDFNDKIIYKSVY